MNIFDQYGIKEVADVTIYSIHKKKDGSGELYYVPALYLDTLKISSVEKTAENVWAQGGLGNSRLICWDYGKNINISLEDALCTPASLGLCWGGILGADWKDAHIKQDFGISFNRNPVEKISRMEKCFYPKNDREKSFISRLLPQTKEERKTTENEKSLNSSSIVDGMKVEGYGYVENRPYKWHLHIETDNKSIVVVPEKFFDVYGRSYKISQKSVVSVEMPSQDNEEFKFSIIYKIDNSDNKTSAVKVNTVNETKEDSINIINSHNYLKIKVDNDNNYSAWLLKTKTSEPVETNIINVSQFKGLDMWNKFDSINEMIYFILSKYEDNIVSITPIELEGGAVASQDNFTVNDSKTEITNVWCYINPKTMTAYPDDYWFNQGEPYFKKSLTFAPKKSKLKSKRIEVTAGQFPGMYMIVGETFIRSRDNGEDERMQIKFPLCKIKSNQTLTLQADGDPTTFNMEVEVAKPKSGIMMEITSYEIAEKMELNQDGYLELMDGSTEILSE